MSWAQRRKASYISGFLLFILLILSFIFFKFFNKEPTCNDKIQNQGELGVDCGGPCTILCRAQYVDPNVLWTRWSKIKNSGLYNILIYVQNSNVGIGSYSAPYSVDIYDKNNIILYHKTGYTYIPSSNNFTIFEGDVDLNDKIPARIDFSFANNIFWQKIESQELNILSLEKNLYEEDTKPKLNVILKNKSLNDIKNIESVAILYDEYANAIAFSKTKIDILEKNSTENIIFTWPEKFESKIFKIEILSKVLKN